MHPLCRQKKASIWSEPAVPSLWQLGKIFPSLSMVLDAERSALQRLWPYHGPVTKPTLNKDGDVYPATLIIPLSVETLLLGTCKQRKRLLQERNPQPLLTTVSCLEMLVFLSPFVRSPVAESADPELKIASRQLFNMAAFSDAPRGGLLLLLRY